MMEIWLRSIARAAGVEVPNDTAVVSGSLSRARQRPLARAAAKWLGRALCRLGNTLLRLAEVDTEVAAAASTRKCSVS